MSIAQPKKTNTKQLEGLLKAAVKKIGASKENDICQYIPVSTGGYIHHFTMRKMKGEDPSLLAKWVNKYITNVDNPKKVKPKKRAARGSRKRKDQPQFSRQDIEKILHMARLAGEQDIVKKFSTQTDRKAIKKDLLASIRRDEVDQELWNSYAETTNILNEATAK